MKVCRSPLSPVSPNTSITVSQPTGSKEKEKKIDTIDFVRLPNTAPKPNFIKRTVIWAGLIFLQFAMLSVKISNWILEMLSNRHGEDKILYQALFEVSARGNTEEIKNFLVENSKDDSPAGYLFSEFLWIPEIYPFFTEILKGGNTCFENDEGLFYRRWSRHPDSIQRISSHNYQRGKCRAISHLLFWVDLDGNTRFQLESSPLRGILSFFEHLVDYLRYKRDNEQQGVTGASGHTEDYCLKIKVNLSNYSDQFP